MKVIITGATSFVGRNLAEALHDDGLRVVATGRSLTVGEVLRKKGIDFQPADMLEMDRLTDVFSPADCVIHCAGRSGDWGRYSDFHQANVVGTRNVVRACQHHDIRKIIFISSPSIYYTGRDRLDVSEMEPLPEKQKTHYSRTKLIAERELLTLQREGRKVMIFRPRAIYGRHDNTFVPRILRLAEENSLPLINDGRALVDVTYIDNFIDGVRASLSAPDSAWNEVYNISNGDPITVREWFSQLLAVFEQPFKPKRIPEGVAMTIAGLMELASYLPFGPTQPRMTRFSVGYVAKSLTMCIDKAKQKLGYVPRISNQEGFRQYAAWYRLGKS